MEFRTNTLNNKNNSEINNINITNNVINKSPKISNKEIFSKDVNNNILRTTKQSKV